MLRPTVGTGKVRHSHREQQADEQRADAKKSWHAGKPVVNSTPVIFTYMNVRHHRFITKLLQLDE
jgi:hypothetical protein